MNMKGWRMQRDEHNATGPNGSDFEDLVTRVDPGKERRIVAHIGAPPASGWGVAKFGIIIGVLTIGSLLAYRQGLFGNQIDSMPVNATPTPAATPARPSPSPNVIDVSEIQRENDVVSAARAAGEKPSNVAVPAETIPPPPPDNATETVEKADSVGIIGQPVGLGLLAVDVENYWVDDDTKTTAYAVLTGSIQNTSGQPMALPPIDVALLDNDKRLYKPSKLAQPSGAKLNPLMKTKSTWFFELPPATPMYCAQFSMKQGKTELIAYVRLGERTAHNIKLMDDEDYLNEFLELMIQASPRIKAQGEYAKARGALDRIGEQRDDLRRQAAKLEKKLKTANDAADAAKANVEKAKKDSENVKEWIKDIDSNPAKFGHNRRLQDIEYGKAQTQAQRCAKNELSAAEALKEKTAAKAKLDTEMKDLQTRLKALATKFETQEKVAEKLKEKIE